jgi:hypothetical protein
MGGRWYNITVVLLWLSTTSWLMTTKVLPPWLVGKPPSYQSILAGAPDVPIGWRLSLDGQRIGWALTTIKRLPNETTELRSRVHFSKIPLDRLLPRSLRLLAREADKALGEMPLEAQSTIMIDPLWRLVDFDSALRVPRQTQSIIRLRGSIDGTTLKLAVHSGDFTYDTELPFNPDGVLGDSLAPVARLPNLQIGQSWNVPSYSPFSPLNPQKSPLELLQARVEEFTPFYWNGKREKVWLVVYRSDSNRGPGSEKNVRLRLWVRRDGTVVQQQALIFGSALAFLRMPDDEAQTLYNREEHPHD